VLVPVVVLDTKGRAIGNLTKKDFQIFVNGKPQTITSFSMERRAETRSLEKAVETNPTKDVPAVPGGSAAPPAERCVIYLLDDIHLDTADLPRVQNATFKILTESLASTDMAAVMSIPGRTAA
jgi:VWFA-related protein